jgi:hypothetical protein
LCQATEDDIKTGGLNMMTSEETVIETKDCPYCGLKFLLRLRMSDITGLTGWLMAIEAKRQHKEVYKEHVAKCLDKG